MLLLKSVRRLQDRSMVQLSKRSHLRSLSLRVMGFKHPNTRIDVRLLGPCFKTGRLQPLRQHPSRSAVLGPGRLHCTEGYNTPREELHSQGLYPTTQTDAGLNVTECTGENPR